MEDRELLEAAAKAAGIQATYLYGPTFGISECMVFDNWTIWNPLGDDGDALRLAVSQNVQVTPGITRCHAHIYGQETVCVEYPGDGNGRNTALSAMTAIRRAIVLAVVGPQS